MNKMLKILIIVISVFSITACVNSSNRGQMGNDMPPRFEKISETDFYAGLNLDSDVKAKVEVILADFKSSFEETLKNSQGRPSKETIEPLIEARDSKVEALLTEEQYVTYKKTVEGLFVPEQRQGQGPRM